MQEEERGGKERKGEERRGKEKGFINPIWMCFKGGGGGVWGDFNSKFLIALH